MSGKDINNMEEDQDEDDKTDLFNQDERVESNKEEQKNSLDSHRMMNFVDYNSQNDLKFCVC